MKKNSIIDVFVMAKNGDKDAQKRMLEYLNNLYKPLVISFYLNTKKLGIMMDDLEGLIVETLFTLFERIDIKSIYDFDNMARFYYIKSVQSEVRSALAKKRVSFANSLVFDNSSYCQDLIFSSPEAKLQGDGDLRSIVLDNEIFEITIEQNKAHLTEKEREILILFLKSYSMKEIAKINHVHYQTSSRQALYYELSPVPSSLSCRVRHRSLC